MKKNMGAIDRVIRIILAIVVLVLYVTGNISGTAAIILGIIAVIFFLTSLVGFCPLYVLFNISTKKSKKKATQKAKKKTTKKKK
jgi:predicted membrane channel-forming protein YqfA (hemolysin III family)